MWLVIVLVCSTHLTVPQCTPKTSIAQTAIHDVQGTNACHSWLRTLSAIKMKRGLYAKFWCQSDLHA